MSKSFRGRDSSDPAGRPFYEPPAHRSLSSQFINDTKRWLGMRRRFGPSNSGDGVAPPGAGPHAIETERPYTPNDTRRALFANRTTTTVPEDPTQPDDESNVGLMRPPSTLSFRYFLFV